MFHLRVATVWIAAAVLCFGVGTAAATDYVYDYDNGRVVPGLLTTSLTAGQDNWVMWIDLGRSATVTDYSGPPPVYTAGIEGLAVTRGGDDAFDTRVNNADWGYSIPAGTEFRVEYNTVVTGHSFRSVNFALAVDDVAAGAGIHNNNEIGFQIGCDSSWFIREANFGSQVNSSMIAPVAGEVYRVVLDVNPTANSGDGLGSLSVQLLSGAGGDLTPVADLQGIQLGLLGMHDPDPSHWDGIFTRVGYSCIMDHLTVSAVPEPGMGLLLILGLTGFGLFLRRR